MLKKVLKYLGKKKGQYKLFILDDDPFFLKLMSRYLSENLPKYAEGHKFFCSDFSVPDKEFMDMVEKDQPELLLLDYHLESATGGEILGSKVLEQVSKVSPETRVIMLTGEDDPNIAIKMMKSGAFDYIVKSESARAKTLKSLGNLILAEDDRYANERNSLLIKVLIVGWMLLISAGIVVYFLTAEKIPGAY